MQDVTDGVRPIRDDDYNSVYEPIARSIFALTRWEDLWRPENPHFVRADWISVLLPCDLITADPRPEPAERDPSDPVAGEPLMKRDPWREAIWVPFMDTVNARGASEFVLLQDWFPSEGPQFSWLERFLYRWVFRSPLEVGPATQDPTKATILPYGVVGPADWDTIVDARTVHTNIQVGVYFVFPVDARWGAYCYEDEFTLLGGEPEWMAEFAERSGGYDAIRARFMEDDGPQWRRRLSAAELAERRERLPRVANWGRARA